ncbi:serine/threonine protein kinase, partial [Micromonospora sp. NPDC050200]
SAAALPAAADDATATVPPGADAAPTAKVDRPEPAADAEPTSRVEPPKPTTPTSVMPAPVSPPAAPAGRVPGSVYDGTKRGNRRRNLLIGAVVLALLVGLAVLVPLLGRGDDDPEQGGQQAGPTSAAGTSAPAAPPPASAVASPTPSTSPSTDPNALPAGWKLHRDPAGFALPLPEGWVRRNAGADTVVFDEPNGVRELLVQWTGTPKSDAKAEWKRIEPDRKKFVNDYQYLSIERCDFWKTCADWEWLETRDNTRIHVRNRGFVTASNRGYAIRWEVAEKDWRANLANFDLIAKGFKPDRQD